MGRGAVRTALCELACAQNAIEDGCAVEFFPSQKILGDGASRARSSQICEVRKDAQTCDAPRDFCDAGRNGLGHGVDQVGAHGISAIDVKVQDEHVTAWMRGYAC